MAWPARSLRFYRAAGKHEKVRMPKITYVEFGGDTHEIEVGVGVSVMEGAVKNGVPGIDADCGGVCACATCHVFIDPAWQGQVGAPGEVEDEMLDLVDGRNEGSRLSCQIVVDETLEGLVVRMPENQH